MAHSGKDAETGRGEISPEDREEIRARAESIGKRLDEVKARRKSTERQAQGAQGGSASGMGLAMRFAADLIAGVGVGGFIGWTLDRQFGTTPWLLAVFVILGFAAGLLNVIRGARRMQAEAEPLQKAAKSVRDDDEDR